VIYCNELKRLSDPPPLLEDYPEFVAPLACDDRYLAPPVVLDPGADLSVRAWRYWYNARGIVEMENRLEAKATAILTVHPWGVDDDHGLRTPEPAGCAFLCTPRKNLFVTRHMERVLNPFLRRLRDRVALVACSMPGKEDEIRRLMYASIETAPEQLDPDRGERLLRELFEGETFTGKPLASEIELDPNRPVSSYMRGTPSTDAHTGTNGERFWDLPMPVHAALDRHVSDLVFYDDEGYPKVRDYLGERGIRHVLLAGYCTDMCVKATTCGYENLSQDFNVFLVGDATMATFPAAASPALATRIALHNAALWQLVTQAGWVL